MINAANIPKKSSVVAVSCFSPKNLTVSRNSLVDFSCKLNSSFSSPSVSSMMLCGLSNSVFRIQVCKFKGALSHYQRLLVKRQRQNHTAALQVFSAVCKYVFSAIYREEQNGLKLQRKWPLLLMLGAQRVFKN